MMMVGAKKRRKGKEREKKKREGQPNPEMEMPVSSPLVIHMPCLFLLKELMSQSLATLSGLAKGDLSLRDLHAVNVIADHAVQ
jgi:hypothetical protein